MERRKRKEIGDKDGKGFIDIRMVIGIRRDYREK